MQQQRSPEIDFREIFELFDFRLLQTISDVDIARRIALYRIKALFQYKTLMDTASTATSPRRRSTLLGVEAALLRAAAEASARACARS